VLQGSLGSAACGSLALTSGTSRSGARRRPGSGSAACGSLALTSGAAVA